MILNTRESGKNFLLKSFVCDTKTTLNMIFPQWNALQ